MTLRDQLPGPGQSAATDFATQSVLLYRVEFIIGCSRHVRSPGDCSSILIASPMPSTAFSQHTHIHTQHTAVSVPKARPLTVNCDCKFAMTAFVSSCFTHFSGKLAAFRGAPILTNSRCPTRKPTRSPPCASTIDEDSAADFDFPSVSSLQTTASDINPPSVHAQSNDEDNEVLATPRMLPDDARIVSVSLPLDAYLEESVSGQVYIDELIPDGNSAQTGLISEGDIIVAVSLPFGDGMFPVPNENALQMVQDYVQSRDEDEEFFKMALISSAGVQVFRQELQDKIQLDIQARKVLDENIDKIYINEYPSVKPQEDVIAERFNAEFLREEGFDV